MRYHQVNDKDKLMTVICISKSEIFENGKNSTSRKLEMDF
jgi:hypothetical protein